MKFITKPLRFLAQVALWAFAIAFVGFFLILATLPDVDFLQTKQPARSAYMDNDRLVPKKRNIQFVPLKQISPYLVHAVLAAEDDLFFVHDGFNFIQIQKAFLKNYKHGRFKVGASTLTQQLARNLFLSKSKSLLRKFRELILTYEMESTLSKKRILELYLNYVEFGPGVYGVKAASRYHFRSSPRQLNRSQSALLASVLPRPKVYGKKPYPRRTNLRKKRILYRMAHYDLNLPKSIPTNYYRKKTVSHEQNSNRPNSKSTVNRNTKSKLGENDILNDFSDFMDE